MRNTVVARRQVVAPSGGENHERVVTRPIFEFVVLFFLSRSNAIGSLQLSISQNATQTDQTAPSFSGRSFSTMAKPPARWQKRHSSTRAEAKILQALFLAVMLILSVPLDLFNIDWLLAERDEASSPKELRRFLLNHDVGEDALDVGLDNVWKRQLRAQEEGGKKSMAGDMQRRMAVIPRYADKHHFDECVGKTVSECQILIDSYVTAHPDDFNDQTTLLLDIRKMREWTDDSYYKVSKPLYFFNT